MGLYTADGLINVTKVSGSSFTGIQAPDGSIYVYDVTNESGFQGAQHPCGALNVTRVDGSSFVGRINANGSTNIISSVGTTGALGVYDVLGTLFATTGNYEDNLGNLYIDDLGNTYGNL